MKQSFFARHSMTILYVAAVLLGVSFTGAGAAFRHKKNDVQKWLPDTYQETQQFRWFLQNFPGEEFVLASWEGCTLDDQRLSLLIEKLVPSDKFRRNTLPCAYFQGAVTGKQMLEQLTREPSNLSKADALERLQGTLIGPDQKQTCVVFTLSALGRDKAVKAVNALRVVASQECNIPADALHLGGPPVDNAALDDAGASSLPRLIAAALLIGTVISWYCLRSFRLVALVFVSGIYSAALSLALVWWLGHYAFDVSLDTIMLTMPSLVYVAAVSGAIHLSNYYRDTAVEHGVDGAPERAVVHAALPLGLATGTTVIGLLTLCINELVPIQLFGAYSALGVASSGLVLCLFLPAAFQVFPIKISEADRRRAREAATDVGQAGHGLWWNVAEWVVAHNRLVTVGGIAVLVLGAVGMTRMQTSVQLMRMFPKGARILTDYAWLEEKLGSLVPMEVVVRLSRDPARCDLTFLERLELVENLQQRINTLDEVGSSMSAVTFARDLPKREDYKPSGGLTGAFTRVAGIRDKYKLARDQYNRRFTEHRQAFIDGGWMAEEGDDELWRISARVSALKNVDYHEFIDDIRHEVEQVVGAPESQLEKGMSVVYTGLVPVIYKAQHSLFDNLLTGFVMDLITVTIVMSLCVREWSAGLVLTLPSVFPVFVVFGFMGWAGILVDTGTVMAPAVALGVTVDDVVHFMLMYRGGLKQGLGRKQAIMVAYQGCARAMYQSWGVIGLGMSVFALSPFTPTQRFGYMMVTLLTSALVGNLIVLPAVLAGPLGAMFGRKFVDRHKPAPATRSAPDTTRPRHITLRHAAHGEAVMPLESVRRSAS